MHVLFDCYYLHVIGRCLCVGDELVVGG
jgi:hypothetical protein